MPTNSSIRLSASTGQLDAIVITPETNQIKYALSRTFLCAGWLFKQGRNHKWQRRHFRLDQYSLSYAHKDSYDAKIAWQNNIQSIERIERMTSIPYAFIYTPPTRFVFAIYTPNRVLLCSAKSEEKMDRWTAQLERVQRAVWYTRLASTMKLEPKVNQQLAATGDEVDDQVAEENDVLDQIHGERLIRLASMVKHPSTITEVSEPSNHDAAIQTEKHEKVQTEKTSNRKTDAPAPIVHQVSRLNPKRLTLSMPDLSIIDEPEIVPIPTTNLLPSVHIDQGTLLTPVLNTLEQQSKIPISRDCIVTMSIPPPPTTNPPASKIPIVDKNALSVDTTIVKSENAPKSAPPATIMQHHKSNLSSMRLDDILNALGEILSESSEDSSSSNIPPVPRVPVAIQDENQQSFLLRRLPHLKSSLERRDSTDSQRTLHGTPSVVASPPTVSLIPVRVRAPSLSAQALNAPAETIKAACRAMIQGLTHLEQLILLTHQNAVVTTIPHYSPLARTVRQIKHVAVQSQQLYRITKDYMSLVRHAEPPLERSEALLASAKGMASVLKEFVTVSRMYMAAVPNVDASTPLSSTTIDPPLGLAQIMAQARTGYEESDAQDNNSKFKGVDARRAVEKVLLDTIRQFQEKLDILRANL